VGLDSARVKAIAACAVPCVRLTLVQPEQRIKHMRKVPLGTIMRLKPHGGRGLCARSGQVSPQLWCKVTFEVVALAKVGVSATGVCT